MPVSWALGEITKQTTGKSLEELVKILSTRIPGLKFSNGYIQFKGSIISSLFDPVVRKLVLHIRQEVLRLQSAGEQSLIYLTGKFGRCKYFHAEMLNEFQHKVPVVMTHNAECATLIGGVHTGHIGYIE